MSTPKFLIYGATGYTGKLTVRYAVQQGLKPIIAGRTKEKVKALANEFGLEYRVFSLQDTAALEKTLSEVKVVLHVAGPFIYTYKAMAEACLATGTHYLDVTGEIDVFEGLAGMSKRAIAAGIMLMPGTGFDVVPTDCLSLRLKERMPDATHLSLGIMSTGGGLSHGTAKTMVENIDGGSAVRQAGKIVPRKAGDSTRAIDFGRGPKMCVSIPWGDVSTAYHSTKIPNIEVFSYTSPMAIRAMKMSGILSPLLKARWFKNFLQKKIDKQPAGPSDKALDAGLSLCWGQVKNAKGETATSRVQCPQGYKLTALTSLNIVQKVMAGNAIPGFQTPAKAYGAGLIAEIEGVEITDV